MTRRVLQVLGSSAGGVARHVAQVTAALTAHGDHVLVAGPASVEATVLPEASTAAGAPPAGPASVGAAVFTPVEIADRPHASDLRAVARLASLAAGADAVHAHGLRAGALTVLAVRCSPRRPGSPRPRVVVTLHNLPVGGAAVRAVSTVLGVVVARGADVVLGVSGDLVTLARSQGARVADRALVPAPRRDTPTADAGATRVGLGVLAGEDLVVTVARLAPQKGLETLVDAAALVAGARPALRWFVAGDGPLRDVLQARVDATGAPVRLLGRREDVAGLMSAADVVASTAVWEGQPLAVQEALGLGAAVVATDAGGTREVTGDAAVLVPVGDAPALAAAVVDVLADDALRARLAAAALVRAAELPTEADVLRQLDRVYG
ncbi:MAG TPA: glycosyltransferase family 4 protein [Cellulomonas sp.]